MKTEFRAVSVFGLSGLLSGALSAVSILLNSSIGFWSVGGWFAAAVLFATLISSGARSQHRGVAFGIAAVLLVVAWPTAFAGVLAGMFLYGKASQSAEPITSLAIGLILGAVLSSFLNVFAFRMIFRTWKRRRFFEVAVAELTAVVVTMAVYFLTRRINEVYFYAHRDALFWGVLLPVGMALTAYVAGRWSMATPAPEGVPS